MNAEALLIGDFIAAVEFAGETPTFTIADAKLVKMFDEKKKGEKAKGTVYFREIERGWVLNRTNLLLLMALYGKETDAWKGKPVTLHAVMVKMHDESGKMVERPGIRLLGSPLLKSPFSVEVKLPRRKAQMIVLQPTGDQRQQQEPPPTDTQQQGREPGAD